MNIETTEVKKTNSGWNMTFNVSLSISEEEIFDPEPLQYDGDYDYNIKDGNVIVSCHFVKEDLYVNETIESRIELIKKDIMARITENMKR